MRRKWNLKIHIQKKKKKERKKQNRCNKEKAQRKTADLNPNTLVIALNVNKRNPFLEKQFQIALKTQLFAGYKKI